MTMELALSSVEDAAGGFTLYTVALEKDGRRWQVKKRYSEFYAFYQSIQKECTGLEHPFPPKGFGKLTAEQTTKRRQQLEAFLRELTSTTFPPSPPPPSSSSSSPTSSSRISAIKAALHHFLEIRDGDATTTITTTTTTTTTTSSTTTAPSPPPPPPPSSSTEAAVGVIGSTAASSPPPPPPPPPPPKPTWSDAFMNSDPLAQLSLEQASSSSSSSPPPPQGSRKKVGVSGGNSNKTSASSPSKEGSKPVVGDGDGARTKPGAAPAFMSSGRAPESYPLKGEGLREAIMNRDTRAVKYLIEKDGSLITYQDRQAETMLHLACIFNLTDIALILVRGGASVEVKNGHDETPIDIAQPALRARLLAEVKARGGETAK